MPNMNSEQLELFELSNQKPDVRRPMWGRLNLQMRYDQIVLLSIAGLLGLALVFACGVERGKQLVRSERPLLTHKDIEPSQGQTLSQSSNRVILSTPAPAAKDLAPAPTAPVDTKEPGKVAASKKLRYAIQLATYSRLVLAKQELERLQARGEQAFLLMRNGLTSVNVGPFTTKANAKEKLADLKGHYQDCFMRTL